MKKPPIFPKDEHGNCSELGYDLQLDFSKFLEEARNHASSVLSLPQSDSLEKVRMKDAKKKTWKRSVSFWFKFRKSAGEEATSKTNNTLKDSNPLDADHRPFSGPLFGNGSKFSQLHQRIRQSTSGPLACCFTPTRAEETEVPYRYLDHQSHPLRAQAFGPIYLNVLPLGLLQRCL
ncbi:hypothetical protein OPV22_009083 [Ensete ventricosum]|uniref:Uncharacterized protein n=1 Tax=Ensete ventricosum TaxID=4639 RepID=A0AAV8RE74_ENSVE|nr:hypothetical protein OPV22_009083 [Ensete ventricosum]